MAKDTIHVSGFASGAYGISTNDAEYAGYDSDGSFHEDSLFGVQATFKPSQQLEATIQMVVKGENGWTPEVTAAYLGYTFDNDIKLRVGKLRLPLFMLSDYLDLGYAQPWARSPEEVYGRVPISSFTGLDGNYEFEFDDSYLNFQVFFGSEEMSQESSAGGSGKVDDMAGLVTTWYDDYWTVRGSYTVGTLENVEFAIHPMTGKTVLPNIESESVSYASFGIRYEDESWLFMGEATQTRVDGYYSDSNAGYITLGYHINQVMPYLSLAKLETVDNEERKAIQDPAHNAAAQHLTYERRSYSIGARWDIQPGLAMKFDVTHSTDFNGTNGGLPTAPAGSEQEDSTTVFTVKIDATF